MAPMQKLKEITALAIYMYLQYMYAGYIVLMLG